MKLTIVVLLVCFSLSQGCGNKNCYNGGTKYCGGWGRKVAKCRCPSWTTGSQCSTITCPYKSCNGRAGTKYCVSRGVSACSCRPGFSGSSCQNGCSYKYCYNGGKKYCAKGFLWGGKNPKCKCPRGWGGHDCRTAVCPNKDCKNGGTKYCVRGSAYCKCQPGYSGSNCENGCPVKDCDKGTKYCANSWGKKVAKCRCPRGWGGHDCRKVVCPKKRCKNKGTRYCDKGSAYCRCQPGYSGSNCENGCPLKTCHNKGTRYCAKGFLWAKVAKCKCALGWHGHDCQKACPSFKCIHGQVGCTKGRSHCVCDKDWKGQHCDQKAGKTICGRGTKRSGCTASKGGKANCQFPCKNGGTTVCKPDKGQYYGLCSCPGKFYGSQCQYPFCSFYLYTNGGRSKAKISTDDKSFPSDYDASKTTVVLIHGWRGIRNDTEWVKLARENLTQHKKKEVGNIIVVEWSAYRGYYTSTRVDAPFAGEKLAALIKHIISKTKTKPSNFYLVGYSLGAQVAGFAGQRFIKDNNNQKLGRITGLDPAGPLHNRQANDFKLDVSDADFVDIIHTDKGGLGTKDKSGHLDFWPNGGMHQRGCILTSCDHGRAPKLFIESITSRCAFRSYRCSSWDRFFRGSCTNCTQNDCPEMGYNAYKYKGLANGNFYLYTNENEPLCVHHYVLVSVKMKGSSSTTIYNYFPTIRLYGVKNQTESFKMTGAIKRGTSAKVILPIHTDLGSLKSVDVGDTGKYLEKVTVQILNKSKESYYACFKKPNKKQKLTKGKHSC